jgi:valyl-tRNA synthetase
MVRHLALFGETPYKSCLINGMVLGSDGRKMSKSLKNYVAAPEVLDKYGSDATRQWAAAGGATGSDIPFRWPDVEYGRRFLVKLWNVSKFAIKLLEGYETGEKVELQPLDKWILSKAEKLTRKVTEAMEKCQFNVAVEEIRNFTWHLFCDYYIEAVKDKLYNPDVYGSTKKLAAQYTLYEVLHSVLQLLAPITPHLTEEIYQAMYAEDKGFKSLQVSPWPKHNPELENETVEKNGDLVMAIMSEVRQDKAENKLPLNAPVKTLDIYSGNSETADIINSVKEDLAGTLKIAEVRVHPEKRSDGRQISPYEVSFQIEY